MNAKYDQEILVNAISFAAKKHKGQFRKGTEIPYITHLMEAATIASTMTEDTEIISAAVLHDIVEDAKMEMKVLRIKFSVRICDLIEEESENKREGEKEEDTWLIRKIETVERLKNATRDAKMIALGDKLSNIRAIQNDYEKYGVNFWEKFHQKDPVKQGWYYTSLVDKLRDLEEFSAFKEYEEKVAGMFSKYTEQINTFQEEIVNVIMEEMKTKGNGFMRSIIYGSQEYDYDDSSLSIYGIQDDGEVDEDMKDFNDELERDIAEIIKNAPMREKK